MPNRVVESTMLVASANVLLWEVSEQGSRQHATCAKCNTAFETGALRLRPAGTKQTRLIHPECAHGMVLSVDSVSNFASQGLATQQRLTRALAHAVVAHGLPGNVPQPNIGDPRGQEILPAVPIENQLRCLELWDQYGWDRIALCPNTIRHVPDHWRSSVSEAKQAVVQAMRRLRGSTAMADVMQRQRLWKLFCASDELLLHSSPQLRWGRRKQ